MIQVWIGGVWCGFKHQAEEKPTTLTTRRKEPFPNHKPPTHYTYLVGPELVVPAPADVPPARVVGREAEVALVLVLLRLPLRARLRASCGWFKVGETSYVYVCGWANRTTTGHHPYPTAPPTTYLHEEEANVEPIRRRYLPTADRRTAAHRAPLPARRHAVVARGGYCGGHRRAVGGGGRGAELKAARDPALLLVVVLLCSCVFCLYRNC